MLDWLEMLWLHKAPIVLCLLLFMVVWDMYFINYPDRGNIILYLFIVGLVLVLL